MSSLINIHIPERSGLPTGKEARYFASNVLNTAIRIGSMLPNPGVFDFYRNRLRTDGGLKDNNIVLRTDQRSEIEFINAKIDITKKNTIKEEAILVSRSGKVKERIQADDYTIKISGSLMGEWDNFPHRDLYLLNQILNEAKSIEAASAYLCIFNIEKLVFKTATFDQSKLNYFNIMPFELNFVSDTDYDFLINEE